MRIKLVHNKYTDESVICKR